MFAEIGAIIGIGAGIAADTTGGYYQQADISTFYNLCGYEAIDLDVPDLRYAKFDSKWTIIFEMNLVYYAITLTFTLLACLLLF